MGAFELGMAALVSLFEAGSFAGFAIRLFLVLIVGGGILFFLRRLFIARIEPGEKAIRLRLNRPGPVVGPGVYLKVPFVHHYECISVRISEIKADEQTNTMDNVQALFHVTVLYRVGDADDDVKRAAFASHSPEAQIRSYVQDALRSGVATLDSKSCFAERQHIADHIRQHIEGRVASIGFVVESVLIANVELDAKVQEAMNSVMAATQRREATVIQADAARRQAVIAAEAEAAVLELEGKGQANKRCAVADGLRESLGTLLGDTEVALGVEQAAQLILDYMGREAALQAAGNPNARPLIIQGGSGHGPSADVAVLASAITDGRNGKEHPSYLSAETQHLEDEAEHLRQSYAKIVHETGLKREDIEAHLTGTKEGKAALKMLRHLEERAGLAPDVERGVR